MAWSQPRSSPWQAPVSATHVSRTFVEGNPTCSGLGHGDIELKGQPVTTATHSLGVLYLAMTQFLGFRKYGDEFKVIGDLTIHGVTREVVLPATFLGAAQDPWGNTKFVFEAELTLNRKDFGLTWNAALETGGFLVGDEVKVSLSVQAK